MSWADALQLPYLPRHLHEIVLAFGLYQFLFIMSPVISQRCTRSYKTLDRRTQINWDMHFVSMVQALLILVMSLGVVNDPALSKDRVLGYSEFGGLTYAFAVGYFVWDSIMSIRYVHYFGVGFALHGVASALTFIFAFRPFLMYYGPHFLLFELSTPFLNINWFMDKTGRASHPLQTVNGVILILTFLGVRILWGWYAAWQVAKDLYPYRHSLPPWLLGIYLINNMSLNILNLYWFGKMIDAVKRRAQGQTAKKLA